MSYILDALRKSDSERQRRAAPSFQSIHAGAALRQRDAHPGWRIAAIVLAIGIAGAGGAWLGVRWLAPGQPAPAAVSAQAAVPPPAAPGVPAITAPATAVATPAAPAAATAAVAVAGVRDTAAAAETAVDFSTVAPILEVWELGAAEQEFLERLEVSLHVYAEEPAQRTVIVNGLRVREGQSLGQDLTLAEITRDGVVVEFRGRRVHLATVGG